MQIIVFMKTSHKNHLITLSLKSAIAFVIMASASFAGAQTLQTLYVFNPTNSGAGWPSPLTLGKDGNFYGTTCSGGTNVYPFPTDSPYYGNEVNDSGTVFKITPDGVLTTLYCFGTAACSDIKGVPNIIPPNGCGPIGLTMDNDGNFYGVTGGQEELPAIPATAFKITTNGTITLLAFLGQGGDCIGPYAGLTQGNDGNFYGSVECGSNMQLGWIFKLTPTGIETILFPFSFIDDHSDNNGYHVKAALTLGNDGNFYGTTREGGNYVEDFFYASGYGTLFRMTPTGSLTNLVLFDYFTTGACPVGALTLGKDGNFYGTTQLGGTNGVGTVFKMTPDGTLTTLVSLDGNNAWPNGALVQDKNGNFYGMSFYGGGGGSIFKVTPTGTVTTLTNFNGYGGPCPWSALTWGNDGNLYGTTVSTVFRLNLAPTNAPPTGLAVVSACNGQVVLSWSSSSGATSYNVKRSITSGSGYQTIGTTTATTYTDTGLTDGTTYYYVVSAVNDGGESANSSEVSATLPVLSLTYNQTAHLLSWSWNGTPPAVWILQSRPPMDPPVWTDVNIFGPATTSTPTEGMNNLFRIYGVGAIGLVFGTPVTPYSGTVAFTDYPTVSLSLPNGNSYTAPANITINVNPSDSNNGAVVNIYQGSSPSGGSLLQTITASPYTYTWPNVPAGGCFLSATVTYANGWTTSRSGFVHISVH